MGMLPLRPQALCEAVADRVRDLILTHALKPGAALNEVELAASFGVSRTPVREALRLLQREGLLTAQARRGMTVSMPSADDVEEAIELRRLLRRHARSRGAGEQDASSLLGQMLALAEQRLRLAHGPAFDELQ